MLLAVDVLGFLAIHWEIIYFTIIVPSNNLCGGLSCLVCGTLCSTHCCIHNINITQTTMGTQGYGYMMSLSVLLDKSMGLPSWMEAVCLFFFFRLTNEGQTLKKATYIALVLSNSFMMIYRSLVLRCDCGTGPGHQQQNYGGQICKVKCNKSEYLQTTSNTK